MSESEKPYALADLDDYHGLDLRSHTLLATVPLHDVWQVELPGGRPDCTVDDLRPYLSFETVAQINPVVRGLFALRGLLGRLFRLDGADAESAAREDPDRFDGPFEIIHKSDVEVIGETRNKTVHAFSVMALERRSAGYRFYWAIYVKPVGRITGAYMALIDPFRRFLVYPAILRHIHRSWLRDQPR